MKSESQTQRDPVIVSGLMAWTANVGGQIRHTEIRSDASPATSNGEKDHG
jgi:hypothetical protein